MKAPLPYSALRACIKAALHVFYAPYRVSGSENIPRKGTVVYLPNHQNALMDVLVVATQIPGRPFFWSRADVFTASTFSFFRWLGILPIYRLRDGRDFMERNEHTFSESESRLLEGRPLMLFPEGSHARLRHVRPLKGGWAGFLLGLAEKHPHREIHIVPVGIHYTDFDHGASPCVVHFGPSIKVIPGNGQRERAALTSEVREKIAALTLHFPLDGYEKHLAQWRGVGSPLPGGSIPERVNMPNPATMLTERLGAVAFGPLFWLVDAMAARMASDVHFTSTARFFGYFLMGPPYFAGLAWALSWMGLPLWASGAAALALAYGARGRKKRIGRPNNDTP